MVLPVKEQKARHIKFPLNLGLFYISLCCLHLAPLQAWSISKSNYGGTGPHFMSVCVCMCLSRTSQIYIYTMTSWPNCEGTEFQRILAVGKCQLQRWKRACTYRGKHEEERDALREFNHAGPPIWIIQGNRKLFLQFCPFREISNIIVLTPLFPQWVETQLGFM